MDVLHTREEGVVRIGKRMCLSTLHVCLLCLLVYCGRKFASTEIRSVAPARSSHSAHQRSSWYRVPQTPGNSSSRVENTSISLLQRFLTRRRR